MAATRLDLPALGKADQRDVGDRLELEDDVLVVAGLAEQGEPGGLAARRGERGVAEPTATACGGDVLGADADEVGEHCAVGGLDDGAVRDAEHQVAAVGAGRWSPIAGPAGRGVPVGRVVVVEQRGDAGVDR